MAGSLNIKNANGKSGVLNFPDTVNVDTTVDIDKIVVKDSSGNVGIGTSSPAQKLEVQDGSIQVYNSTSSALGASQPFGLKFRATNQIGQDRGTIAFIKTYLGNASDNDFGLIFQTQSTTAEGLTTKVVIDTKGNLLLQSGTGGLGYGTGAGGTVTQPPSDGLGGIGKGSRVTLNKPSGQIIMNNAALAAGTRVTFTLNNSLISSNDTLLINFGAGSYTIQSYNVWSYCWNGTATIVLGNISAGSLSEQVVLSYELIKGATA